MSIIEYIQSHNRNDYQRDNFDAFLKKVKFSYSIPSIHVAGTNGKGSVSNYIADAYINSGLKVGVFTSPAVVCFNEMIQISHKQINEKEIEDIIEPNKKLIDKFDLSSFEIITFVALTYFQNNCVDVAVIECGMGGEVDATNIFDPILAIITSISLEHTDYLGKSLSEIAVNKAGIVHYETPLLIGELDEESEFALVQVVKQTHSKIHQATKYSNETENEIGYKFDYSTIHNIQTSSHSIYSMVDATIAIEALKILASQFPVNEENIKAAIINMKLPGRMTIISESPLLFADGAHNPEAIENLRKSMETYAKGKPIHVVFASFKDKNIQKMLPELDLISSDISLTTFDHPRSRNKDEYFILGDDYPFYDNYVDLIKSKLAEFPNDIILVTGSLAFVGRVINDFKN